MKQNRMWELNPERIEFLEPELLGEFPMFNLDDMGDALDFSTLDDINIDIDDVFDGIEAIIELPPFEFAEIEPIELIVDDD